MPKAHAEESPLSLIDLLDSIGDQELSEEVARLERRLSLLRSIQKSRQPAAVHGKHRSTAVARSAEP